MAKKTNYLPWLIGGVAAWFLLRKKNAVGGIVTNSVNYLIPQKIAILNFIVGSERYTVSILNNNKYQLFNKEKNKLEGISFTKKRFSIYLTGIIEGWTQCKGNY